MVTKEVTVKFLFKNVGIDELTQFAQSSVYKIIQDLENTQDGEMRYGVTEDERMSVLAEYYIHGEEA